MMQSVHYESARMSCRLGRP